jgi:Autographiviridae terminase large subunit
VASGGFIDGYSDATLKGLAAIAARYKITDVVLEENYGGGMFSQLLMPKMIAAVDALKAKATEQGEKLKAGTPLPAEDVWHSKQKELFICDTLEPIIQNHRLVVDRRVIEKDLLVCHGEEEGSEQYSLIWQMTHMHREKKALPHEDRLEAVAMACQFFQELMDRDADKMHAKHNEKLKDAELAKFKKSVFLNARSIIGGSPAPKVRVFQNLPHRG